MLWSIQFIQFSHYSLREKQRRTNSYIPWTLLGSEQSGNRVSTEQLGKTESKYVSLKTPIPFQQ